MRALIWIVAIFAVAAGIAMLAGQNEGYVLVVSPPWRAQLSLNFVIVGLIVAFVLLYVLVRILRKTLGLPGRVGRYRARRREEKSTRALHQALRALFEGRYGDALSSARAADSADASSFEVALVAARAAHGLKDARKRAEWLDKAGQREGGRAPRLLEQAAFAIDVGEFADARAALDALREGGHRSVAARQLALDLALAEERWDEVAELVPQLQSERALPTDEARRLQRAARIAGFRRRVSDATETAAYWRDLPKEDMADRKLIAEVVPMLAATGQGALARRTVERLLEEEWDSELARQYSLCAGEGAEADQALKRAEKWLAAHPDDAGLLASVGRQCMAAQIWGKAQSYLEESLVRDARADVHRSLAELFERLERADDAARHYREAARLAKA
ncbi:MAG: heme biosynthesis protein HemY [Azoarcus sp.]|nr:heme biosynthesis protein HemY [Azoarcus sp.]